MSLQTLKDKLYKKIAQSNNDEALQEIYRMLELSSYAAQDYPVTEELENAVKEGQQQYQKGDFVSNDDAQKEFKKWLN